MIRRAADLYPARRQTDPRDAWILADYARRNPDRLTTEHDSPPTPDSFPPPNNRQKHPSIPTPRKWGTTSPPPKPAVTPAKGQD